MDKATELAHRIIPLADSEWPMTPEGRAIAVEHAATIIRSALADERERCAKVAETHFDLRHSTLARIHGHSIAAAIREME